MAGVDPLAARLARGDAEAFEEVYDTLGIRLHAYLWGHVGDRQVAEDLLQTVMLRLVRHRHRLHYVENLRAWLYVVARNEARRHGRHVGARTMRPLPDDAFVLSLRAPDDARDVEALQRALLTLSPERFEVVTLKVHHDLTFLEIAEVLDISANTAASRYRRALSDLRKHLETVDVER